MSAGHGEAQILESLGGVGGGCTQVAVCWFDASLAGGSNPLYNSIKIPGNLLAQTV